MSDGDETPRPTLRVVRGEPSPEELAALTALVAAAGDGDDGDPRPAPRRGGWNDPTMLQRRRLSPGPGAWRASLLR